MARPIKDPIIGRLNNSDRRAWKEARTKLKESGEINNMTEEEIMLVRREAVVARRKAYANHIMNEMKRITSDT